MKILLRATSALLALGILAGVVHLGILSGSDTKFVVWFGIASAIAAPAGLSLLTYAFARADGDLIERLAKVPEIERLVADAKTQEEKLRVLETQQARLAETIRLESRRQAVRDRVDSLERDAVRILDEMESLDTESRELEETIGHSIASEEIARLRQRVRARQAGDIVFSIGKRAYRIDRDIIKALPFGIGNITLAYFRLLESLGRSQASRRTAEPTDPKAA